MRIHLPTALAVAGLLAGLACQTSPDGRCTLPCTGATENNEQCLAAEVDTSMHYNSIYGRCRDGFCGF